MGNHYYKVGYVSDSALPEMTREDLRKLTHINVAFGHVRQDEIVTEHLKQVQAVRAIKREHPELKILLSVGGWSAGGFSEAASTETGRQKMAASAVRVIRTLPFDGIDLDWEYPCYGEADIASSPADKENFTLLLRAIREALDAQGSEDGRHYMLTIAAGADQYYVDGTEMDKVQQYLDYVQLMTYDMRGGFQVLTGHHTNLHTPTGDLFRISVDASVRIFANAGVPRNKIVIGAAFYSRKWSGVPGRNNGLHQMAGTSGGYGPSFTELDADYINKQGFIRYWDNEACAPYLFDGSTFISYEDEQSLRCKCEYVISQGLAGIMFWEYSCDKTHRLLDAINLGFQRDQE
ncbi:glycoside hydrolase family 18 protein [Paenibacillus glycanilyticus]|uniref:glycoside hydrolase family 18 protein n=1 Tax=Paenibacillus glycanilyticus TaxID=126569 RepID=UPI002040AF59|nr:glycoside hydrolase family 18 protein [Paenibacillus glycanilyticus]MCM3627723.1 glycoside hydrolase family 18 protein [Paenibacillus glycanilyticus]